MKHESHGTSVQIDDTDITFDQIYQKDYIPCEYSADIKKADFLIIPNESHSDGSNTLFPETTLEFYDYCKEMCENKMAVDIAASDESFQRIELHSAIIDVATIIVKDVFLALAINIISSFLYDLVTQKYHRQTDNTSAKVKIIAEETKNKKSKIIKYEGPVSGIEDALEQATKDLFSK